MEFISNEMVKAIWVQRRKIPFKKGLCPLFIIMTNKDKKAKKYVTHWGSKILNS
jgi:hypothetical protein